MTGANTQLLINGKPIPNATSFSFNVSAKGLATANIEVLGKFKIKGKLKPKISKKG